MAKQVKDVYGNALFEVAVEENRLDEYLEEVIAVGKALEENEDLSIMMTHPQIGEEEKKKVLETIFKGRVSDELYALMDMLREKGHFGDLLDVLMHFVNRVKEYRHIGVVYIETPMELPDSQKKAVEKKILDTTDYVSLEMHFSIDPSLIGGMVIRIGDRVVDSSVRSRLDSLVHVLSAGR
jgi:F-type H+-transporting ATPase subunit delta